MDMVGLLGRGINPTQGLFLHRTAHHRKTRTDIHASTGTRTHDPSVRATARLLGPADLDLCRKFDSKRL